MGKMKPYLWAVLAASTVSGLQNQAEVTPVQKVIEMLEAMHRKGLDAKNAEIQSFRRFEDFCQMTKQEKEMAIKDGQRLVEKFDAKITREDTKFEDASEKAKSLKRAQGKVQDKLSGLEKTRKKEREAFQAAVEERAEGIDALGRAIDLLRKAQGTTGAAALIQVAQAMRKVQPSAKNPALNNWLNHVQPAADAEDVSPESLLVQASAEANLFATQPPEAAYETGGSKIIDMLREMKREMTASKEDLETREMQKNHAFQMMSQDLTNELAQNKKQEGRKESESSAAEVAEAKAKKEKASTAKSLNSNEDYLQELNADCTVKAQQFESRQKARGEELEAIEQAVTIIKEQVAGTAKKLGVLQQSKRASSLSPETIHHVFAQFSSQGKPAAIFGLLQRAALRLKSNALSLAAAAAQTEGLDKVRDMIQSLIERLEDQAREEAGQKSFCDEELESNRLTREEHESTVEQSTADIESLSAEATQLGEAIAQISKEITELQAGLKEMTEQRAEERKKNQETIADSEDALGAVKAAQGILQKFYGKNSLFLQGKQEPPSAGFDSGEYKGMGSGGIMGMLDVISTDFVRLTEETKAEEENAQRTFENMQKKTSENLKQLQSESTEKSRAKSTAEVGLKRAKKELKQSKKALGLAENSLDKLRPTCIDTGPSFEEQQAKRKEEIENLQEALQILEEGA